MRGKWIFGAASAAMLAAIGFAGSASAQEDQTATAAADRPDTGTHARIALGATVNGALTPAGKKDWYRLSARTGMLYRISLNGAPGANSLGDPLLRVVAANGDELGRNDDDSRPRPAPADGAAPSDDQASNLNSYLEWTPARSGDVFVEARGFDDAATGAYALHVDAVRLPPDPAGASVNTNARINVGQTLSAGLDYAGDKDWYRIRLEQGHSYRFALNAVEGDKGLSDPMLRIMSSTGTELASDDDSGDGLNAYLEFTPTATGNYFLEARGFGDDATGNYTLSAKEGDIPADATTDASLSAEGDSREGMLSPAGDKDWYRVHLDAGQSMRVALDGGQGEGMLADPFLTLYGPDGKEIAHDDDGGTGLNSWLEFIAPAAGDYFLEAKGFGEDATGKYTITLTAGEIPGVADGAQVLTPGSEGFTSTISPAGDKDWFQVDMVEGRPYRFNVKPTDADGLADPVLTLFDSDGKPVATDDDGGSGSNAYLNFVSVSGGTYYAQVSGFDEHAAGGYTISVSDTDVPGSTSTDETLAADDGDDRTSAIEVAGDLDDYSVTLTAGVHYDITLSGVGDHPLGDPFLTVLNAEGTSITTDDDSGPGNDSRLNFVPQSTGTFFLQASGVGGSTGTYKISISRHGH